MRALTCRWEIVVNNELTQIIYSIVDSSYRITKYDLCKAVCDMDNMDSIPRCASVSCYNCPVFSPINDMDVYPNLIIKVRELLNE